MRQGFGCRDRMSRERFNFEIEEPLSYRCVPEWDWGVDLGTFIGAYKIH